MENFESVDYSHAKIHAVVAVNLRMTSIDSSPSEVPILHRTEACNQCKRRKVVGRIICRPCSSSNLGHVGEI
ncbi:hypothetical protein RSOLAG1IB_06496 [Rhizoctonia solani AG-1 IB]|uniref:Uncharacterized protein n=1 Tax=Thanatephorus cucumeris (strain AG1-IB / isolate 7/3/14) TaxID=1108050 RepID=A0A0B7F6F1_THACB|nr:hypothetical protein RSOLAG1IB_06496 [Rhizoctonia solani AG-1 IB]